MKKSAPRKMRPSWVLPMVVLVAATCSNRHSVGVDAYASVASPTVIPAGTAYTVFVPKEVHVVQQQQKRHAWSLVVPAISDTDKADHEQALADRRHSKDASSSEQRQPMKYDLGIGKNAPVVGSQISRAMMSSRQQNQQETTQYLMEHEAVRSIPSPKETAALWNHNQGLYQQQQEPKIPGRSNKKHSKARHIPPMTASLASEQKQHEYTVLHHQKEDNSQKAKMKRPKLDYRQRARDALFIQKTTTLSASSSASANEPKETLTVGWKTSDQLDPNTIWVEMLLAHSEQAMLRAAAAHS
ncbi:expressed unknown protein [Seminavis robusta]|uniref:Uncharacterized protein n=1 Tax=Seminavis robusta TaxID=568900 RepID=A0A9N8DKG7_9STRA|nr:expressed unknown protein [Seminavis robusta]|eukprot:Sro107_g053950.1 n/a (299) ;mRNA; f:84153-85049